MLSKFQEKRLLSLQNNYDKPLIEYYSYGDKLEVRDFILLLQHDEHIRKIIRDIVHSPDSILRQAEEEQSEEKSRLEVQTQAMPQAIPLRLNPPPAHVIQQPDALRTELAPELRLLNLVTQDAELARAWLGEHAEPQGRQLVRLIAVASQWSQILLLWDRLAERCRQTRRPASMVERQILETSISLHNLVWDGKQAQMEHTEISVPFDHDVHERGTPTGDFIREEWLPGLLNAAGSRNKKILAATS